MISRHEPILWAVRLRPDDERKGVANQLARLDAALAELRDVDTPGAPADSLIYEVGVLAQSLYYLGAINGSRGAPDWYLGVLEALRTEVARFEGDLAAELRVPVPWRAIS